MGKIFHLQRLFKSLETQCLDTAAPSNHKAVSISDALWETQHILFSLKPVQGGWTGTLIRGLQNGSRSCYLQPPSPPSPACAHWCTLQRCFSCTGLCCRPQLVQVLVPSVTDREVLLCGAITTCSWNINLCQAPRREQASVCLMSPSLRKHLFKPTVGRINKQLSPGEDFLLIRFSSLG